MNDDTTNIFNRRIELFSEINNFYWSAHELLPLYYNINIKFLSKFISDPLQKWISEYQETGDVQDDEGRGRKRKTSEKEDT